MRLLRPRVTRLSDITIDTDLDLDGYSLLTDNLAFYEELPYTFGIWNRAKTGRQYLTVYGLRASNRIHYISSAGSLEAWNVDNAYLLLQARKSGVGLEEVARIQGATTPTFDLKQGRLTGNLNANSQEIQGVKSKLCDVTSAEAVASGSAGVPGAEVTVSPIPGYYAIVPFAIALECTAFAGTASIDIRAKSTDGVTVWAVTKTFTTTGIAWLTPAELGDLILDSSSIVRFAVDVITDADGDFTSKGTIRIIGFYT